MQPDDSLFDYSQHNEVEYDSAIRSIDARRQETEVIGRGQYFRLRKQWSWFLFAFLTGMIIFQFFVTIAVGLGWMNFLEYKTLLGLVLGENFLQIVGMCVIVVTFLFPRNEKVSK